MTDEPNTTVTLSPHNLSTVRKGLDLLVEKYDDIAKRAEKVADFHIQSAAQAEVQKIVALKLQFAQPSDQLEAFDADEEPVLAEPDDRPLHLRLFDQGYNVRSDAIESDWNDLDRENVTDWLERRRTANPKAAPPSILVSYRAVP